MCTNTLCKPGTTLRRCCSKPYWWALGNKCLIGLVNRQAVTIFALIEAFVAMWAIGFYFNHDRVGAVVEWTFVETTVTILALSYFRVTSAALGVWAAWFRKVLRTRLYLFLVFVNILFSLPVVLPIWHCKCDCQYRPDDPYDVRQCEALRSYEPIVEGSGSPQCPSTRWLSNLGSVQQLLTLFSPQALLTPPARRRAAPPADEAFEVQMGAQGLAELVKLLEVFTPTDAGIMYQEMSGEQLNLTGRCQAPQLLTGGTASDHRDGLRALQCGGSPQDIHESLVARLTLILRECLRDPSCGVVELTVEWLDSIAGLAHSVCGLKRPATPTLDYSALSSARTCMRSHDNCSESIPSNLPLSCSSFSLFFMRREVAFEPQIISEAVRQYCSFINAITLVLFLGLTLYSMLMTFVIYMFIQEHCGDKFATKNQFEVEFEDSGAFDDEFDVGTWVSLEERRKARDARRSMGTAGGSLAPSEMTEDLSRRTGNSIATEEFSRRSCSEAESFEGRSRVGESYDESFVSANTSPHIRRIGGATQRTLPSVQERSVEEQSEDFAETFSSNAFPQGSASPEEAQEQVRTASAPPPPPTAWW